MLLDINVCIWTQGFNNAKSSQIHLIPIIVYIPTAHRVQPDSDISEQSPYTVLQPAIIAVISRNLQTSLPINVAGQLQRSSNTESR